MKHLLAILSMLSISVLSSSAFAATYSSTVSFTDTDTFTESGNLFGSNLQIGESAEISLVADVNDFWTAGPDISFWLPIHIVESGTRTGNYTYNFINDGVSIFSASTGSASSSFAHIGQEISLASLLTFDTLVMTYSLSDSTSIDNTMTPLFASWIAGEMTYHQGVSSVPVPAAAFLFAPALLGFMGLRRKAKQA